MFFIRGMITGKWIFFYAVRKVTENVEVFCAMWDLMHYAFNLAQKPIRGTNSDITTSAHIAQNTCYGLPFQDNALGGLCKTHNK